MAWALYNVRAPTLVTFGDAVASFLNKPDQFTQGMCLQNKRQIAKVLRYLRKRGKVQPNPPIPPMRYRRLHRQRWFAAASMKRWSVTLGLISCALAVSCFLLALGVRGVEQYSPRSPFALGENDSLQRCLHTLTRQSEGFGKADVRMFISSGFVARGAEGLMKAILLANLPQTILSVRYYIPCLKAIDDCTAERLTWSHKVPLSIVQRPVHFNDALLGMESILHGSEKGLTSDKPKG